MVFRRPGSGPKSKYITPEGYRTLTDELMKLWNEERPRVTQEVADAALYLASNASSGVTGDRIKVDAGRL